MMKKSVTLVSALALAAATTGIVMVFADEKKPAESTSITGERPVVEKPNKDGKVVKSDGEWRKKLTAEQYRVTREAGTERPFGEAYAEFHSHKDGTYFCVGCGAELFTSSERFDSGCGWPSFYDPSKAKNIAENVDRTSGMVRTEVVCTVCDAHLGHVFEGEGYKTPTDKRYCINAVALRFVPGSKKPVPATSKKETSTSEGKKVEK